jgi:hypothetical protein
MPYLSCKPRFVGQSIAAGLLVAAAMSFSAACSDNDTSMQPDSMQPDADLDEDASTAVDQGQPDQHQSQAIYGKTFDSYPVPGGAEKTPCLQWTFNNEEPLYVNAVNMTNEGGFHHSNWYIVPERYAPGADGFFDCQERGWSQQTAAIQGTVLFAQSTQARTERQAFPEGVVTKIPPHHKIISDVHFLNASPDELNTQLRLELELLHPGEVDTIATPFQMIYLPLDIPAESESRFTAECDIATQYEQTARQAFEDLELYYILPHYHGLGNYFEVKIHGGPNDGQQLMELSGFNAEANGHSFNPPIDLSGATGLEFSCGFDNPRSEAVGWGIGDQEMCMLLGYSNGDAIFDAGVHSHNQVVETGEDGIVYNTGPCRTIVAPRARGQSMPSQDELDAELYVPDSGDDGGSFDGAKCEDTPSDAQALREPTLSNIKTDVFSVGCSFSACHGGGVAPDLTQSGEDLHSALINHDVYASTDLALVAPGDPQASWLYQILSNCEPQSDHGTVASMPRNSPVLLAPDKVALVRDWIEAGANND